MQQQFTQIRQLLSLKTEREQLDLLYRDVAVGVVLGAGINAALAYFFWHRVPLAPVALWACVSVLVHIATLLCCRLYHQVGRSGSEREAWAKAALVYCFALGLINGAASWVFYLPNDIAAESLLHLALAGSCLGALVHLSSFLPALYAYALGMTVALMPRNLWVGDYVHYVIFFLTVLVLISTLAGGHSRAKTMAELFRTRNQKRDLAEALRREYESANQAREQAELANKSKSQFFAAANHDLRQPLHALALFAQALKDQGVHADVPKLSTQILACVDNLGALFDELLDISRLDAGMVQSQSSTFALSAVFDDLAATHRPVAQAAGLALHIAPTELVVHTDRVLLLRVLSNLLSNAIRYTKAGSVNIHLHNTDESVVVTVQDTGLGIGPNDLPHIFDEFYQVGNTQRDRSQGLGLGLATVRRISELLGLDIAVQSHLGQGSEFSVRVPLAQPGAVPVTAQAHSVEAEPARMLGKSVLVVDDEAPVRQGMHQLLTAWGSYVALAANWDEACDWIDQEFVPDFVVADMRMANGESGIQTVERLRERLGRQIPAVLISGDTQPEQLQAAKAAGLKLLHKPVKPAQLRALFTEAFAPTQT
jgi:two-component system, sensor histidine kinase